MIAQELALTHPERVASLASIMSTTGDPDVGHPRDDVRHVLTTRAPTDREGYADNAVANRLLYGSPGVQDTEALRAFALSAYDRAFDPAGVARQYAAIQAADSRTERLAQLTVPTLVIHGDADGLIDASGGRRTAQAVPGSRLEIVEGMGHDLHPAFWDRLVDLVADHALANP
ncbi:MAG TPA: alpha/beta fold hydrolase, partial [Acidimicrobiales bacterium]|nr:alpha/beta fold hydrolase [Acidimicrobiales bacterium]